MSRPGFVSGGVGSFLSQIDWHGIPDGLNQAVSMKLPNVLISAPCNANLKATVGIHRNTMCLRYRKLQPRSSKGQANSKGLFRLPLAKKLDGNLWWNLLDSVLNFLGGPRQPIRVDVDSYATPRTGHMLACLEPPDCLFEILPAFRALKPDLMEIYASHRKPHPI
jgi:hypothetical protein